MTTPPGATSTETTRATSPETATRSPPPARRTCSERSPRPAPPHAAAAIPATAGKNVAREVRERWSLTSDGPLGETLPLRRGVNRRHETTPTVTRAPTQEKKRAGATPRKAMPAVIRRRVEAGPDMPPALSEARSLDTAVSDEDRRREEDVPR